MGSPKTTPQVFRRGLGRIRGKCRLGPDLSSPAFNPKDLNTLIPAGSPLYLWFACSINSGGAIIGIAATSTGQLHGYLLTPSDPALGSSGIGGKRAGGCGADRTGMVSGAQTKYY